MHFDGNTLAAKPGNLKPLSAYKALFFDAGDTLITIPGDRSLFNSYLAGRSLIRDEERVGELLAAAIRKHYVNKPLVIGEPCSPETDRLFWTGIYRDVLRELGAAVEWSEREIEECSLGMYEEFLAPRHYRLFPDVMANLERFRTLGLRLGLVSNFSARLRGILADKGILGLFDPVVISVEVGLEKPDPAIFKLALSLAELDASDVLYIGDHELNDIWAPSQAGIDSVRIKRYDYHTGAGITSLDELA